MKTEDFLGMVAFFFMCWLALNLFAYSGAVSLDYICDGGRLTQPVRTSEYELREQTSDFIRVYSMDGERVMMLHRASVGPCEKSVN